MLTISSPLQFVELGIEHIIAQDGSWMKIMSNSDLMLWQPLDTKSNNNTSNKSLSRISSGDHKRTQQRVSAELLFYVYKLHMVHAT